MRRLLRSDYGELALNVGARLGALASVFVATLLLAHGGGPAAVGIYALLHVIPGLIGTIISAGLPGAVTYFLAGSSRSDRRLPTTIAAVAAVGGVAGALLWIVAAPFLGPALLSGLSLGAVTLAGALVVTRLVVTTAKSCSQGSGDLTGAARVIFTEEFLFLPAYAAVWAVGGRGNGGVVASLLVADVAAALLAWHRLVRRGFFASAGRPSTGLARDIAGYGMRAQLGTIISQLNLRLDFVLLTAMTGPAVLGVYAVASKFAELIRVFAMAVSYVLYPKLARIGSADARRQARRLIPRGAMLSLAAAVPLWATAGVVVPAVYGESFRGAVLPARIILLGLALEGVGGVITGYLLGVGRPGRNSAAMACGLVMTVVLDLMLIPPFGTVGAAVASAAAYTTATLSLVFFFWRSGAPARAEQPPPRTVVGVDAG